jgi:hypothetical protein
LYVVDTADRTFTLDHNRRARDTSRARDTAATRDAAAAHDASAARDTTAARDTAPSRDIAVAHDTAPSHDTAAARDTAGALDTTATLDTYPAHDIRLAGDIVPAHTDQTTAGGPATHIPSASSSDQSSSDPACHARKKLTAADITILLKEGPIQPARDFSFPKVNGRCFQPEWFYKTLPDKAMNQHRKWLSYSVSSKSAFCLPCLLFGGPLASRIWTYDGWNNFSSGARDIDIHEMSKEHRNSEIAQIQWMAGRCMDQSMHKTGNVIIEENRKVVSCVVYCVKYLAQEMVSLLGHDSHGGKLQNLFRLIAGYSPSAAAYIARIDKAHQSGKKMVSVC